MLYAAEGLAQPPAAASEPESPFAQLGLEFPADGGYQPLLEPLLQDRELLASSQSTPAALSLHGDSDVGCLRVTAAHIGTSRFRRSVSMSGPEPSALGQPEHATVLLGTQGPERTPSYRLGAWHSWVLWPVQSCMQCCPMLA